MASLAMARVRLAELCLSSVAGQVAMGKGTKAASVRFPFARGLHYAPQRLMMLSTEAFSSSPSLSASPLTAGSFKSVGFRRPDEIPWDKTLVNSVTLIGFINESLDIKYLDTGKITAKTSLRVRRKVHIKDSSPETVFQLQFWDELAEVAAAHLRKEDRVYIAGSVWVESYVDNKSIVRSICKVVARDLKFVGDDYPVRSDVKAGGGNEEETTFDSPEAKLGVQDQWMDYFKNPSQYWDNRASKRAITSPDFKHKSTGAALWISNRQTPSWVRSRLAEVSENDQNIGKDVKVISAEKAWQRFFADPTDWWDNRNTKVGANHPDFKNKWSGEGLWIEGAYTPSWVKSQLELFDSKTISFMGGGRRDRAIGSKEENAKTSFEDEDFNFF